jgi:glycosyltransferase involved in cell wall biosynthesis
MTVKPLISIAMATYNGEKYLKEQLDSIYAQTYKNIEVIVTDDCSTDKTVEILEQYTQTKGLKYYVNESNLGFVRNFEKVISLCSGTYIALSDQDDIWFPNKIDILFKNIGKKALACSDASLMDDEGVCFSESLFKYANNHIPVQDIFIRLLVSNFVTGCTVMAKKTLFEESHPIPNGIEYHDWWYGIIAASKEGIYIHRSPLLFYRQHDSNEHGAQKSIRIDEFINQLMHTFKSEYQNKRRNEYKENVKRLCIYQETNHFLGKELNSISDMLSYYRGRIKKKERIKVFLLAFKYRKSVFFNDYLFVQWIKSLRVLF